MIVAAFLGRQTKPYGCGEYMFTNVTIRRQCRGLYLAEGITVQLGPNASGWQGAGCMRGRDG